MRCEDCRDAISARLDGEDLPGEADQVDAHLVDCAPCGAFAERAAQVTRLTRTRAAEAVPDLVPALVTAVGAAAPPRRERRADAVRLGLGAVGVGQFGLAISGVVTAGAAHHRAVELAGASAAHFAHESSAWNLALAVGFLWAAAGPRVSGLVPVVGAFVGVLSVLSVLDAVGGRVDPGRLLTHGLVVVGFVLLLVLRRTGVDGGGNSGARPITRAVPPRLRAALAPRAHRSGSTGLAPTARRAA